MPKQFIIKLRNYFVKNNELTARKISTYHKTIKFGILIQAKEIKNPTAINTFVSSLQSDGKKVSVLCFCENKSSLYFDVDFDQFVPPHLYADVARILIWVMAMRKARQERMARPIL